MSFSRKVRRAKPGEKMPPEWKGVAAKETDRTKAAMGLVAKELPGRGLALISVPDGAELSNVDAIACCTNMPREQLTTIFQNLLDWWHPSAPTCQPDTACTVAVREMVLSLREVPVSELLHGMPESIGAIRDALKARNADAAIPQLLKLATEAFAVLDRIMPAQESAVPANAPPSGFPEAQPLPPRRQWPKGDTKTTLVNDLLARPQTEWRDKIIELARQGSFHDHESDVAGPKMMLVEMLARFGYPDLAGKARDGGYDDEPMTVGQAEELRAEVGPETYDSLMGQTREKQ